MIPPLLCLSPIGSWYVWKLFSYRKTFISCNERCRSYILLLENDITLNINIYRITCDIQYTLDTMYQPIRDLRALNTTRDFLQIISYPPSIDFYESRARRISLSSKWGAEFPKWKFGKTIVAMYSRLDAGVSVHLHAERRESYVERRINGTVRNKRYNCTLLPVSSIRNERSHATQL